MFRSWLTFLHPQFADTKDIRDANVPHVELEDGFRSGRAERIRKQRQRRGKLDIYCRFRRWRLDLCAHMRTIQGAQSKAEIEKLLRHGAYDIFNEDKAGSAEAESNAFVQQDIDTILQRRSRVVIHDNTGSSSNAAGSTFSKASFKAARSPESSANKGEDIDLEDPDFWTKMIGVSKVDEATETLDKRRIRSQKNYAEDSFTNDVDASFEPVDCGSEASVSQSVDDDDQSTYDRGGWGGSPADNRWKKDDAVSVFESLFLFGYGSRALKSLDLKVGADSPDSYTTEEVSLTTNF
jgi:hypothetical protein